MTINQNLRIWDKSYPVIDLPDRDSGGQGDRRSSSAPPFGDKVSLKEWHVKRLVNRVHWIIDKTRINNTVTEEENVTTDGGVTQATYCNTL